MSKDNVYTLKSIHLGDDGQITKHRAGRFLVLNGHILHLEDYHGHLHNLLPQGKLDHDMKERIAGLRQNPYLELTSARDARERMPNLDHVPVLQTPEDPDVSPEQMQQHGLALPPSVFEYHREGMDKPHTIEFHGGQAVLDGNPLKHEEMQQLVQNASAGLATLRYKKPKQDLTPKVAQMEQGIKKMVKAEDPEQSLRTLQRIIGDNPEGQAALAAHRKMIFEDPMVEGIGNKLSFGLHRQKSLPGIYGSFDLNEFKDLNDTHGHQAGDDAITAAGKAMREAGNEVGTDHVKLFRPGGDEFVGHFATPEHAYKFARLWREKMDALPPVGGTHAITASMGFGNDFVTADKALNRAKEQKYVPGGIVRDRHGKIDGRKSISAFQPGQVPHFAHSAIPGSIGPVPLSHEPPFAPPPAEPSAPASPPATTPRPTP